MKFQGNLLIFLPLCRGVLRSPCDYIDLISARSNTSTMTTDPAAANQKEEKDESDNVPPASATQAVLVASAPVPEDARKVRGVDFNQFADRDITVPELVANMANMGFQASAVADAVRIINEMV